VLRILALATCLTAAACQFRVDPDRARFECDTVDDCGKGYECRAQAAGGSGLCFKPEDCSAEQCNGDDDDCDGEVDNGFDLTSDAAHCGACGQSCGGGQSCVAGVCQ